MDLWPPMSAPNIIWKRPEFRLNRSERGRLGRHWQLPRIDRCFSYGRRLNSGWWDICEYYWPKKKKTINIQLHQSSSQFSMTINDCLYFGGRRKYAGLEDSENCWYALRLDTRSITQQDGNCMFFCSETRVELVEAFYCKFIYLWLWVVAIAG